MRFQELHGVIVRHRRVLLFEEVSAIHVSVWGDQKAWKRLAKELGVDGQSENSKDEDIDKHLSGKTKMLEIMNKLNTRKHK